jgi:uncharacterized protein (DUF1800 family)
LQFAFGTALLIAALAPAAKAQTPAPTRFQAARFLTQATYGPTLQDINNVVALGYAGWIEQQFATPSADTHWDYVVVRHGPVGCTVCNAQGMNAVMESFWKQAVEGPDQLRQRVVLALSELFVVSQVNSNGIDEKGFASYLDMLSRNAFGNFRTLLWAVSTNPAMGHYLTFFQNMKEDPTTGAIPDENYAREVMQLFTIGLWRLNPDGSRAKDSSGNDIPIYAQADVSGLAKVFTGWSWNGPDNSDATFWGENGQRWHPPMQSFPQFASASEKDFLGKTIAAGTSADQSMMFAVDALFRHPNVGPFVGEQLIKRLVTSSPSRAYVQRVAAAFANNGSGVRGDMEAVIRAVLLDPEARSDSLARGANWGKLREPIIRYANFLRAFQVHSRRGYFRIWDLEDPVYGLGQNPLRAPSVFNFFSPSYAPPGPIQQLGLTAPEFQITDETTVTGYANFITTAAFRQADWYRNWQHIRDPDYLTARYAAEERLAMTSPQALLDRLNLLLCAGRMSADTRATVIGAVNAIPTGAFAAADYRVATAISLTMVSPDYIVQK